MKKLHIASILLILLTIAISKIYINKISSNSLSEVRTYQELIEISKGYPVYSFNVEDENYGDVMLQDVERIFEKLDGNSILTKSDMNILVVTVGEYFSQNGSTYMQTAIVNETVKCNESILGKEIFISFPFGVMESETKEDYIFWGTKGHNILIPDHKYLVFCEKNEVSDFLEKPTYRGLPMSFGYIDLTSDFSAIVDLNDNEYKNYIGSEFFVNNQKTLDSLLIIKNKIIEKYYLNS